jgi:hypothetical protein
VSSLPPVINLDETLAYLQSIANQGPQNWIGLPGYTAKRNSYEGAEISKQLLQNNKATEDGSYDLLYECDVIPFQQDAPL